MDLNFFYVKQKHRMWLIRLKAFLLGIQPMTEQEAVSSKDCDLGKWLYSYGMEAFNDFPEMKELEKIHKDMHNNVKSIIQYKNANKNKEALESFNQMVAISSRIVKLLETLEESIENKQKIITHSVA